jgi:ribosomal protein L39E
MIRKSGSRLSEKIMLHQEVRAPIDSTDAIVLSVIARHGGAIARPELSRHWRVKGEPFRIEARLLESAMAARRITLRVQPPMPFGDVTMVPATLSGRPEADMARAMTAAFADVEVPSAADVFNRLRQSFRGHRCRRGWRRSASLWTGCAARSDCSSFANEAKHPACCRSFRAALSF